MTRLLEAVFRHRVALPLVLIAAMLSSLAVAVVQPNTYRVTTHVWFAPSAFGIGNRPNAPATPADAGAAVFQELLGSRAFCITVGRKGPLAEYLSEPGHAPGAIPLPGLGRLAGALRGSQQIDDALEDVLQKNVAVRAVGADVVAVSFSFQDAGIATGTLQVLLDRFGLEIRDLLRTRAVAELKLYQSQIAPMAKDAERAAAAVAAYLARLREGGQPATPINDATLMALQRSATDLQTRYSNGLRALGDAGLRVDQLSRTDTGAFKVIDPQAPPRPVAKTSVLLAALAGGLAVGLFISGAALGLMIWSDTGLASSLTVEDGGAPIIGRVPRLRRRPLRPANIARTSLARCHRAPA